MTEKHLQIMGFRQEAADDSYYYAYSIGGLTFITNECKDEVKNDEWSVDVFDNDTFKIKSAVDMIELISILERSLRN
jgi:hypothetical protein